MSDSGSKSRSNLFVVSVQLDGICEAIRLSVSMGAEPGPGTITALSKMREHILSTATGAATDFVPEIKSGIDPHELLSAALILRMHVLAFLSPEDLEEHKTIVGFQSG